MHPAQLPRVGAAPHKDVHRGCASEIRGPQMLASEPKQLPSSGHKASLTIDPQLWWLQSALSSGVPEVSRDTDIQRGLTKGLSDSGAL